MPDFLRQRRAQTRYLVALSGLVLSFIAIACGPITENDARRVLNSGREIQRIEDEIQPIVTELQRLEADEIQPREQRLRELETEMRAIYEDEVRPLQDPSLDVETTIRDQYRDQFRDIELQQEKLDRDKERIEAILEDPQLGLDDAQRNEVLRLEAQISALNEAVEELKLAEEEEARSLADRILALEQSLSDLDRDLDPEMTDLSEDIQWIEDKIAEIQGSYELQIDELKAETAAQAEELESLRLAHATGPLHQAIDDLDMYIAQVDTSIADRYASQDWETAPIYDSIAATERALASAEPGSPEATALEGDLEDLQGDLALILEAYELEISSLEGDLLAAQAEIDALYADHETDPDHAAISDLESSIQAGEKDIDSLYADRDQETTFYFDEISFLEDKLDALVGEESARKDIADEIASLQKKLAGLDERYRRKEAGIKEDRFALEDELRALHRRFEDEQAELRVTLLDDLATLDERGYELQELRWALMDAIRDEVAAAEAALAAEGKEAESRPAARYDEVIAPLEEAAATLTAELDDLYANRQSLVSELQVLRDAAKREERVLGTAVLDVLEITIDAFADEASASEAAASPTPPAPGD